MKSVGMRSFSGLFSVQMRKVRTRKTSNTDTFYAKEDGNDYLVLFCLTYGKYPNRMVVTVKFRVTFAPHLDTNVYDLI